ASDGKTVAAIDAFTLNFWNVPDGKCLGEVRADANALAYVPDGKTLAFACSSGRIAFWDAARRTEKQGFPGHSDLIAGVAITPGNKSVITGSWDGTVRTWELDSGKQIRCLPDAD